MRWHLFPLLLIAFCLLSGPAFGADPPHWTSANTTENCTTSCHLVHDSLGSTLTNATSNVNLCQSCHRSTGSAKDRPIYTTDIAVSGQGGTSHAFDVNAVHSGFSTQIPTNTNMQNRVYGGKIVCSTCHDQHAAVSSKGGTPRISPPKQIRFDPVEPGTGVLSSSGTYTGPEGSWYLVEIQTTGNQTSSTFRYSKDNGTSWMASGLTAGPSVALDSGVSLSFGTGTYVAAEQWQFYSSWPFLRITIDSGDNSTGNKFCRDCHSTWTMNTTGVETYDGNVKGHPVGQALQSGGRSYDRTTPLDGDGSSADANPSNNLKLDSSGNVQCWTCHGIHYADSNTQTTDGP